MNGKLIKRTHPAATAPATRIRSKALQVNLEATDRIVTIAPRYRPLEKVLEALPGLHQQTQALLCELNHPFKNWAYAVREIRNYALRNFAVYYEHPQGLDVIEVILDEWLASLAHSSDPLVHAKALDNVVTFVERILVDGKNRLRECMPILSRVFEKLTDLPQEQFFLLASGYYQIGKIAKIAVTLDEKDFDFVRFAPIFRKTLETSYIYWLEQEDPVGWYASDTSEPDDRSSADALLRSISHSHLRESLQCLRRIDDRDDPRSQLKALLTLPGYGDIVKAYRNLLFRSDQIEIKNQTGLTNTLQSLLKVMQTKGLSSIHEDALGRLNRCFSAILLTQSTEKVKDLLERTFDVLKKSSAKFPEAALQAIENIGKEVFKSNDGKLISFFIESTIALGFQCPEIKGTTAEWKVEVNPTHLANIKAWLHLIENDPKRSKKLVSALIVNLKLAGLYIKDTDLFQKEISRFLNNPISPVYNLAKQLAKLFPVYFNDINAEGELRDVSTEIDELSNRGDVVIHFLRKQSHVESNNLLIDFTRNIIEFWRTKDKSLLAPFLPPEILAAVQEAGPFVDGVHGVVSALFKQTGIRDTVQVFGLDMPQV